MKLNQGWIERVVRALIGTPTAVSYMYVRHFYPHFAYALLGAGLFLVLTSLVGHCPLHHAFGTSTLGHAEPTTSNS